MSNPFFSTETLMKGGHQMLELIKDCAEEIYQDNQKPLHPNVEPGFLRHQLPQDPPEEGNQVEHLIQMTRDVIFPGTMKWQSPKFFGYFVSSINVTNIFGDMFAVINQTPNFSFATAPSWTQLENVMMDWSAKALGLPDHFQLKNSGGGIINNSASESIFNSVHIAKYAKRKQLDIELNNPDILKFVGYFGEGSHVSSERALTIKDIFYRRAVPYIYNKEILNYELNVDKFEEMVEEDIKKGLIPFWFGFSFGNTFCSAVDVSLRAFKICKKHNIFINVDAAWLGSTWISQNYRPQKQLLEYIDAIDINFSKLLLSGTGGSLFFVKDKKLIAEAFGASSLQFHFYKNKYTGHYDVVDYKDWIVGLARRNNALKLYYTFDHYGFKKLRDAVEGQQEKMDYLLDLIKSHPKLFEIHTVQYGVVTFAMLDRNGSASNELTKGVNDRIGNIPQGFSSSGYFKERHFIRMVVGQFHGTNKHTKDYFDEVVKMAEKLVQET